MSDKVAGSPPSGQTEPTAPSPGPTVVRTPATGPLAAEAAAATLLKLEAGLRTVRSFNELTYYAANEFRPVTRSQQACVVNCSDGARPRIEAVSSLSVVDRSAPLIVALEAILTRLAAVHGLDTPREFEIGAFAEPDDPTVRGYPLPQLLWLPFLDLNGGVLGGLLQARTVPWTDRDITIGKHLAGAVSFAWLAVKPRPRRFPRQLFATPRRKLIAAAFVAGVSLFPVSMSALAPAEVAPKGAYIVTAGVDGVVEAVDVDPNAAVTKGQTLVRIGDTVLRNRYEIAAREVVVAESQQKRATQLAFVDMRGRHELAIAQSELDLRLAERNFAKDMLERATVVSAYDGVAFFTDKKDLIGRPVAAGEKLMEIVDPESLQFNIDLPVADAIVLKPGARVKIFLDYDPLDPIEAVLVRADYKARVRETQQLAFRLVAELAPGSKRILRLGVRGTAQVYSDRTPFIFYLLRRPLAAARQMIGI